MKIIIVGAGASGLFLAANLRNHEVVLFEKNQCIAKKMLLSGNGRCNVTNDLEQNQFIDSLIGEKKMALSFFSSFNNFDIISYFGNKLKKEGRNYFSADNKAKTIVDFLFSKFRNLKLFLNSEIKDLIIEKDKIKGVKTEKGIFIADVVVLATGGLSFKHTGSDGFSFKALKSYHKIVEPYPLECGIIMKKHTLKELSGLSFKAKTKINNKTFKNDILITHKGFSGPLIFDISFLLKEVKEFKLSLLNDDIEEFISNLNDHNNLYEYLKTFLPKRFIKLLLDEEILKKPTNNLSLKTKRKIFESLTNFLIKDFELDDLDNAYVTGGGFCLKEFSNKFESKKIKNLFVIGESLNIHGPIGGYNISLCFSQAMHLARYLNAKNCTF